MGSFSKRSGTKNYQNQVHLEPIACAVRSITWVSSITMDEIFMELEITTALTKTNYTHDQQEPDFNSFVQQKCSVVERTLSVVVAADIMLPTYIQLIIA